MSIFINEQDLSVGEKVRKRIAEIGELKEGWLNGAGHSFDKKSLYWASSFIIDVLCPYFEKPAIIPCEGENLSLEWIAGDNLVSVELIFKNRTAIFDALNQTTNQFDYDVINLNAENGVECLIRKLQKVLS